MDFLQVKKAKGEGVNLMGLFKSTLIVALLSSAGFLSAQTTILSLTFPEANNATSGTNWSLDLSSCSVSGSHYMKVNANKLEARDTDCDAVFYTTTVDLSEFINVSLSVDLSEIGGLSSNDWIRVQYSLDGGAYQDFATNGYLIDDFTSAVASQTGLNGDSVKIKIIAHNDSGGDYYYIDNILAQGTFMDTFALTLNPTNGVCDTLGSIDLVVTPDSVGGYTYLWSNDDTTQDLTAIEAGVYIVTVTNYHGRAMVDSVTITDSSPVIAIAGVKNVCSGGSTTLTASGGVSYLWSTGATTASIVVTAAGTYTVTGTDSEGCAEVETAIVTSVNNVSIALQAFDEHCINQCDGSIESTPQGGSSPYTYTWSNSATTQDITGVCSGQYIVTVTDNQGCTATNTTLVNASSGPIVALSATNVYCAGDCSGTIDLTMLQGVEPFTFTWSDGPTTQDRTGLCIGSYCVTVSDVSGCTVSACMDVTEFSNLSILFSTTEQDGDVLGSASTSVYGGTPPYTYEWSNYSTASSITDLEAGLYSVSVTDNDGVVATGVVVVNNANQVKSGSYIINMGVVPQTFGNGLKPYGMVYDLVRNYNVPVKWIINPSKSKDGTDFTYDGTAYKGGPFIIEAEYRSTAVDARIAYWETQGVVGTTTTDDIVVPVFETITGFANLIVDENNENLVIPYFTNAGIPSSIYTVGLPSDLNGCHDTYVLPHADPTWTDHSFLRTFNTVNKGYIWSGCHAVSVLEGIANPSDTSQRMNFLSTTGLQCHGSGKCGSLITETHGDPTSPYTYDPAYNSDPIMQFMGDLTPSTENGSEDWYIPLSTGGWNSNTSPAITTSDGSGNGKGVKLVYGPGYNNTDNGMVMYEAGHTSNGKGSTENQVAAQRAFFNFIIMSSIDKGLQIDTDIPSTLVSGDTVELTALATTGSGPYTYSWSSNCAGTFSNDSSASVTFIPGDVAPQSKCVISVVVTDNCGRRAFVSQPIVFLNSPPAKLSVSTDVVIAVIPSCFGESDGTVTAVASGGSDPYTYLWSTGDTTAEVNNLSTGSYIVTSTDVNGCVAVDTHYLEQPAIITATSDITNVSVSGGSDGIATIIPAGGTPPFSYSWSTGDTLQTITGVPTGTYYVTITDASSCTTEDSVFVNQPCTCIASGNWSNPATWTGICSGGGGKYPGALDDILIQGYQVTVDSTHTVKSLELRESSSDITKLSYTGNNSLNVLEGFNLNTVSTGNDVEIELDGSSELRVNGDFTIDHTNATDVTIKLNSISGTDAKLYVGGNLELNLSGSADDLLIDASAANDTIQVGGSIFYNNTRNVASADMIITMASSSKLLVGGDIDFNGVRSQNMELILNGTSTLKLGGSIVRNDSPTKFGAITMATGAKLVLNGNQEQTLDGNTGNTDNINYTSLEVYNTSATSPQVVLNGDVTVSGNLTLTDGNIGTGANMLIITNTSGEAVNGHSANSYVVGTLRRYIASASTQSYDFPLGYGAPNQYYWARIISDLMVGPTYLTASFGAIPEQERNQSILVPIENATYTSLQQEGIWTIDPDIQPIAGWYNIVVGTQNFSGLIDNLFRVIKRPTGSGIESWGSGGGLLSALNAADRLVENGTATVWNLTSFSEFGVAQGAGQGLPIDLLDFTATVEGSRVRLDWTVSMEINNDYFTIERSLDGVEFTPVGTVKGGGNHSIEKKYQTYDENPELGLSYYRLKQTDFDGKWKTFDMVSVMMTSVASTSFDVFPNPNKGTFTINLDTPFDQTNVMIMNNMGQMVYYSELLNTSGKTKTQLNLGEVLATGIYFIRVDSGKDTYIKQMIVE